MLANQNLQIADLSFNVERPSCPKSSLVSAGEVALINIGDLFDYKVMLGFRFVTLIIKIFYVYFYQPWSGMVMQNCRSKK